MLSYLLSPPTNMPSAVFFLAGPSSVLSSLNLGNGWPHPGSVLELSSGPRGQRIPHRSMWSPTEDRVGDSVSEGQRMPSPKMDLNLAFFRASRAEFLNDAMGEWWGGGGKETYMSLILLVVCLLHSPDYVVEMKGGTECPALTEHHTTSILLWPVYISILQSCPRTHL